VLEFNAASKRFAGAFAAIGFVLMLLGATAFAHTPSETYLTLTLNGTNLTGRWDVALRDLHQGMGLDVRDVPKIAAAELQSREEALALDIAAGLSVRVDEQSQTLQITDYTTLPLNGIDYARLLFQAAELKNRPAVIEIDAAVFFRIDTNMHGLLRLEHAGGTEVIAFNGQHPSHRFDLTAGAGGRFERWLTMVSEGVWHIWIGLDHILFLIALLLPAVLRSEGKAWVGVDQFRRALINVLKIVTAFTVAHSITLSLAALDILQLPTRLVESVIAASVALAALNNLWPVVRERSWLVAFGFGLIHGFGFASVLGDLGVERGTLALALVGFNVGVELGQLAIVVLWLPAAFALRDTWFYQTVTFKFGSVLVVLIAFAWMLERSLALKLVSL